MFVFVSGEFFGCGFFCSLGLVFSVSGWVVLDFIIVGVGVVF